MDNGSLCQPDSFTLRKLLVSKEQPSLSRRVIHKRKKSDAIRSSRLTGVPIAGQRVSRFHQVGGDLRSVGFTSLHHCLNLLDSEKKKTSCQICLTPVASWCVGTRTRNMGGSLRARDLGHVLAAILGDEDVVLDAHAAERPETLDLLAHQELGLDGVLQSSIQQLQQHAQIYIYTQY